jgi:hypothetical protein
MGWIPGRFSRLTLEYGGLLTGPALFDGDFHSEARYPE